MRIEAKAKVNLTLDILGVREDGYHSLRSVMAPVSLCDVIDIDFAPVLSFSCSNPELETESNLCVLAARAFLEKSGVDGSVSIYLQKNIPFPAGLAGGSSDAAAVLRGMNILFDNPLDEKTLFELAESLGSDVPFCLLGECALCEGRGELLTPLPSVPRFSAVVAIGDHRLSTSEMYRTLDESGECSRSDTDAFLSCLASGSEDELIATFGNAFEPIAEKLCHETKDLREELLNLGAVFAGLSGSGPSVFGIFRSDDEARHAVSALIHRGFEAHICIIN